MLEQVGFESSPCDAIIHAFNNVMDDPASSDSVAILIDLKNAFNLVKRSNNLKELSESQSASGLFDFAFTL